MAATYIRRKPQDETSRSKSHHELLTVEQAQRSVSQNTVTIVQSTVDHHHTPVSGEKVAIAVVDRATQV